SCIDHPTTSLERPGQAALAHWYWCSLKTWHGRPARESRARCACHNQAAPAHWLDLNDSLSFASFSSELAIAETLGWPSVCSMAYAPTLNTHLSRYAGH